MDGSIVQFSQLFCWSMSPISPILWQKVRYFYLAAGRERFLAAIGKTENSAFFIMVPKRIYTFNKNGARRIETWAFKGKISWRSRSDWARFLCLLLHDQCALADSPIPWFFLRKTSPVKFLSKQKESWGCPGQLSSQFRRSPCDQRPPMANFVVPFPPPSALFHNRFPFDGIASQEYVSSVKNSYYEWCHSFDAAVVIKERNYFSFRLFLFPKTREITGLYSTLPPFFSEIESFISFIRPNDQNVYNRGMISMREESGLIHSVQYSPLVRVSSSPISVFTINVLSLSG